MKDLTAPERMVKAIREYFKGEKIGAALMLAWSALLLISAWQWLVGKDAPVYKGMVPPLVALSLVQMALGIAVLYRSIRQEGKLLLQLTNSPQGLLTDEGERMKQVMANMEKTRWAEQLLLAIGFGLLIGGTFLNLGEYMLGAGIGLSAQAAISLVFDLIAGWRAGLYQHELKVFERDA